MTNNTSCTGCPTRCQNRHSFNNFTTNEDIATKFEADLPHCVRNVKEKNVLLFKFRCNIFISVRIINPLKPELNPICYLLALLAHHFLHVSRIRVKSLTIRLLMSYIYMEHLFLMFLDHTQRRSTVGRTPLDE